MEKSLLTVREKVVFDLLVMGKTTKEIANLLFISKGTVRIHISNVVKKLKMKGRTRAVLELIKLGEFQLDE